MDAAEIKSALIGVLTSIQGASGLPCPPLNGTTKPIEELPEFDSKIWPIATGMLAGGLGITIPDDVNIFAKKDSDAALAIDEIVEVVLELAKTQVVPAVKHASV